MLGRVTNWVLLGAFLAGFILIPYAALGTRIEAWTAALLGPGGARSAALALLVAGLLGADIVLPIPSSLVSTAAGYWFGVVAGTLISFVGMMVACVAGYWIGAVSGRAAAARLVGAAGIEEMTRSAERYGLWGVVLSRPAPVLAEASVLLAGIARVPFRRFFVACALANLGISLVYAAAGALSATTGSFFLALAAAVALPAVASRLLRRRGARDGAPPPSVPE